MNQNEQMLKICKRALLVCEENSRARRLQITAAEYRSAIEWLNQALNHVPDTGKMVEPTPKKFVQSDKGRVAVVINKGANGRLPYGIVIEESVHHSNPILIADFVQEKDALLFAKIWNNEIAEPAMLWPDEKARGRHD